MTVLRKVLVAAGALFALAIVALALMIWHLKSEALPEYREREAALKPLLQSHATRSQVSQALRVDFVDYSAGSTNRWVLEQRVSNPQVRQRADLYPEVFFSTTPDWMTWLFFDSEGRLQDYYLCAQ